MIATRGFDLVDWQRDAVRAWDATGRGTLEIFTGGGKSMVALACAEAAARREPQLKLAIVVPTEALARQWINVVSQYTNIPDDRVGLMGAGGHDVLVDNDVLVAVLNTAAKLLPEQSTTQQPLMLVVDECHRAGAPTFSQVFDTTAQFRLGLSATPDREELDADGEPLQFDEQVVGRGLGPVVYRFGLRDARRIGWLPDYSVHHHGVALLAPEQSEYERISRRIDDAGDQLRELGGDSSRAWQLQIRNDELGRAARGYVALTSNRKDVLYRALERERVAVRIVQRALDSGPRKVLLFHERVNEAEALARALGDQLGETRIGLEHSRLPDSVRESALQDFRSGTAPVLVSVKSLVEGIDVPDADVGVSVAASASVRQRVQSLGRVLRRQFDESADRKTAEMHLVYVADTVDELIYSKEDWGDITGESVNHYWKWPTDPELGPERLDGPPATPKPTEEAEWERLGRQAPAEPVPWLGSFIGQEYSVDTMGNVTNRSGIGIANPQDVDSMIKAVRNRPGGRFWVTPEHRLVLATRGDGEGAVFVAGQLKEPFEAVAAVATVDGPIDVASLAPGDRYPGPANKELGSYKTRAKSGGVIQRRAPEGGTEFALTSLDSPEPLAANAHRLLAAWRSVIDRGITFHVNALGHAWYTEGGTSRFLADVTGGFAWPSAREQSE
jgi:superfamily II DNA or RNA helicase